MYFCLQKERNEAPAPPHSELAGSLGLWVSGSLGLWVSGSLGLWASGPLAYAIYAAPRCIQISSYEHVTPRHRCFLRLRGHPPHGAWMAPAEQSGHGGGTRPPGGEDAVRTLGARRWSRRQPGPHCPCLGVPAPVCAMFMAFLEGGESSITN